MISNVAGILLYLSVCGIVGSNPDRAVDCRKFVFAPLCRGVAAKRNPLNSERYEPAVLINDARNEQLSTSLNAAIESLGLEGEYDNRPGTSAKSQNEMERIRNMYAQDRINRFLRLLLENREGSSERDNFPGEGLENL